MTHLRAWHSWLPQAHAEVETIISTATSVVPENAGLRVRVLGGAGFRDCWINCVTGTRDLSSSGKSETNVAVLEKLARKAPFL